MPKRVPPEAYAIFDALMSTGLPVRTAALRAGISANSAYRRAGRRVPTAVKPTRPRCWPAPCGVFFSECTQRAHLIANALAREGYRTPHDVARLTDDELLAIRLIGPKHVDYIRKHLLPFTALTERHALQYTVSLLANDAKGGASRA